MIENAGIDYKELYLQMQSAVVALSKALEEIQKEIKKYTLFLRFLKKSSQKIWWNQKIVVPLQPLKKTKL